MRGRLLKRPVLLGLWLVAAVSCLQAAQAQAPPQLFHVQAKWVIGGLGRWHSMALDPESKLLYVTRQDHLIAIDTKTGKQVFAIGGFQALLGIALDRSFDGYVTDAGGGSVVVFDRQQGLVSRAIPAGRVPSTIVFDPSTNTIWAFDLRGRKAIAIDARTQAPIGPVALPGRPGPATVNGKGSVYAAIDAEKNGEAKIVRINAKTRRISATWPLEGCRLPTGIAIDDASARLFAVCGNGSIDVLSAVSGKAIYRLRVGCGASDARFSPADRDLFVTENSGSLKVIKRNGRGKYFVAESVPTLPGAGAIAISPDGRRIYLAATEQNVHLNAARTIVHPRPAVTPGPFVVLVVAR